MASKAPCRFCGRGITTWRFTGYLRPHKWTREQAAETQPGQPYGDGWCPGGQRTP